MHRLIKPGKHVRGRRLAAVLALVGAAGMIPTTPSMADGIEGFSALARAEGGRMTFRVPAFLIVEEFMDGGGPIAQSVVETYDSASFASLPYPGDLGIAGPGTASGVTGQQIPFSWPFYVAASYPTAPKGELADPSGTYKLTANAAPGSAAGTAVFRQEQGSGQSSGSGGTKAVTSITSGNDKITAVAETANEALNLGGGALRVLSVRSRSETTYVAGQEAPQTKTDLVVEGGSAGGYTFAFGRDGLTVASQGVPLPAASGLEQLNKSLEPVGLSIRFSDEERLVGGAAAKAFEVVMRHDSPAPGVPGMILTMRFGGATTSVSVAGQTFAPPAAESGGSSAGGGAATAEPAARPAPPSQSAAPSESAAASSAFAAPEPGSPAEAAGTVDPNTAPAATFGADTGGAGASSAPELASAASSEAVDVAAAAPPVARMPVLPATPAATTAPLRGLHRGEFLYLTVGFGSALLLVTAFAWSRKGVTSR